MCKLVINQPVIAQEAIYLCDSDADIEIRADLRSLSDSVYILGRTVTLRTGVQIEAFKNAHVTGMEQTNTERHSLVKGKSAIVGTAPYPAALMTPGRHLSESLYGRVTQVLGGA